MEIPYLLLGWLFLFEAITLGIADDKIHVQDLSRESIQILSDSTLHLDSPRLYSWYKTIWFEGIK